MGAAALGLAACTSGKTSGQTEGVKDLSGKMLQNYPGIGTLGYGCMRWPTKDGHIDQDEVNRLVDCALEHGVNYFDTSPVYTRGESETATSIALNRHPRESWLLATKLSNMSNPSYDASVAMYHRSLEFFKTDYIDYYLLHSVRDQADFERRFGSTGIMDFLMKERELGHIRHLGFSFHGHEPGFLYMMSLHEKYHWDFVQIQMNYVDWQHASGRNCNADFLYNELDKREIPVVIMEPLRGGALSNMAAGLADKLKAREPEKSLASWAFRFVGSYPRVMAALSGMTYMEHLEDNLDTFLDFEPMSDDEKKFILGIADDMINYPLIPCTNCQYCMPCQYGIDIPGIFKFYNDNINAGTYVSNGEQEDYARAKRKYLLQYSKAIPTVRQADHCIGCGKCRPACPQYIDIPAQLSRIDHYLEQIKQDTL